MLTYKPNAPFSTPLVLLVPTFTNVSGVKKKSFPAISDGIRFNGSFKTFGGTERDVNGVYSVEDTANIECWYDPRIKSDCRIAVAGTGAVYEVLGDPENIDMRNQYMKFKVTRVKGGA